MLTQEEVRQVARLARLGLTPEEEQLFTGQIATIVTYMGKLQELSTGDVFPTSHVLPLQNVFREDLVQTSLTQEAALANAPDREGPFFKVPPVLEDPA